MATDAVLRIILAYKVVRCVSGITPVGFPHHCRPGKECLHGVVASPAYGIGTTGEPLQLEQRLAVVVGCLVSKKISIIVQQRVGTFDSL